MIRRFALGGWAFVVGEDWRIAAGVVLALGATAVVAALGIPAWWVAPLGVLAILGLAVRGAPPRPDPPA
jgi:hypothetical protein